MTSRVLIVEDDVDERHLLTVVMRSWALPIEIASAGNGFEALLKIGEINPDLLLTDLDMPGMDGFQMIGALQLVGSAYAHMKIVVVTGMTPEAIERRGPLPPHVQVLAKPVPFGGLQGIVRDLRLHRGSVSPG